MIATPDGKVTITQESAVSLLSPLNTAWVEENWTMTDLDNPVGFDSTASRISGGGLRITGELGGAVDFSMSRESGGLILSIDSNGKVSLLDKTANAKGVSTPLGKVSDNYSLIWEIKPDGSMRIILDEKEVLKVKVPLEVLDFSKGGVNAKLTPHGGFMVSDLRVGTIGEPEVIADNPPALGPTATPQGEGGNNDLPTGAYTWESNGIKGVTSPTSISNFVPRFEESYRADDCTIDPNCINTFQKFNSLQEAENYWKTKYPNGQVRYNYWLFDDGGVMYVRVQLLSTGN